MSAKKALEEYTQAARDLHVFDAVYSDIMEQRAQLQASLEAKLGTLKTEARAEGKGSSNRYFEVVLTKKEKRSYDAETLIHAYPEVTSLVGVIVQSADRELVDTYVRLGTIPEAAAHEAEVIEPMTTAISIRQRQGLGRVSGKTRSEARSKVLK